MSIAASLSRTIDVVNYKICKLVSWLTLFMVLITLLIVVLRYGFDIGWIAMQESVMYLHACVFLLGSAHTLRVNEHVRVDIFYCRFDPRRKAKVDILGTLVFMLPVNFFVFIVCWNYVVSSWNIMEDSQAAGGIPAVYLLKTFILLFAGLMVLQGVAELIRNLTICFDKSSKSSIGEK